MTKICAAPILFLISLSGCTDNVETNDPMPVEQRGIDVDATATEPALAAPDQEEADPKMQSPVAYD